MGLKHHPLELMVGVFSVYTRAGVDATHADMDM